MHQHFRYACSRCGNVMQCRCPGTRVDVEVDACPDCVPGTRLPGPLRANGQLRRNPELPAARGDSMLPALPAQSLAPGQWLPPRVSWDLMLSPKTQQFVYLPDGVQENTRITTTLGGLLTRSGIASANAWEDLLAACGTRARLFVIDRWGERYEVREVLFDYGGETGRLVVRHVGARGRQGDLEIDIHKAVGYMLPVVVYKPR